MEIFSVPEDAVETLRRAVYDSYERFLFRNNSKESDTTLNIRGGTCPLSGRSYMNVVVLTALPVDLQSLNLFTDTVFAAHPLREDDLVRKNRFIKIEDSAPSNGHGSLADENDLGEADLDDEDLACWICGRFDGEEYRDFSNDDVAPLEVRLDPTAGVPLCSVCSRILKPCRD